MLILDFNNASTKLEGRLGNVLSSNALPGLAGGWFCFYGFTQQGGGSAERSDLKE
jgi:hypothetical protein